MKTTGINLFSRIALLTLSFLLITSSCSISINGPERVTGSKNVVSEVREVGYFNAIQVSNAIDLIVTIGEEFHLEVKADDNIVPLLITEVEDDVLKIFVERGFTFRNVKSQKVYVTLPLLTSLSASGASNVSFTNPVMGDALSIKASGASDIKLEVELAFLEVRLSGASDLKIGGFSQYTNARLSGASDMKSYNFACDLLEVVLSGASDIKITVNEKISGNLSGASGIKVKGNPATDVKTSGASSVQKL